MSKNYSLTLLLGFAVLIVGGLVFLLTNSLVVTENTAFELEQRESARQFAFGLKADIEQTLNERLFPGTGLRSLVEANDYEITEEDFTAFAEAVTLDVSGIRSVQLAPDAVVTYVYPREGNEAAIGHDLLVDDARRVQVLQSIENNAYVVTGPVDLIQGGTALIAREPIYKIQDITEPRTLDNFWGFATVLINIEAIYGVIESNMADSDYKVAIRGRHGQGAAGEVFYGDPTIFDNNPIIEEVLLPVGTWQIAIVPSSGWQTESDATKWFWATSVLLFSLFIVASIVGIRYIKKQIQYVEGSDTTQPVSKTRLYVATILVGASFLSLTIGVVWVTTGIFENEAEQVFLNETATIVDAVSDRVDIYVNALEGGRGLFSASENVTREEWKLYVESLNIQQNYPGIQGIGYSVFVAPEERTKHVETIRSEGFPEYDIHPAGERDLYTAIVYLEPFDIRNKQAFGFDMFQEANRNAAMSNARDTGLPWMSHKITLVQEIDDDVQAGFLIYVPYYENNAAINTLENRQENIVGYVYSPFRARDFMEGILGVGGIKEIGLEIYDADQVTEDGNIYSDVSDKFSDKEKPRFSRDQVITLAGQDWLFRFNSTSAFGATAISKLAPYLVAIVGLVVSILSALIFFSFNSSKRRAEGQALVMTRNFRRQQKRLDSFHSIVTMPNLGLDERIKKTLNIVTDELGLEIGIVSRINDNEYTIKYAHVPTNTKLKPGDMYKIDDTYCAVTYKANSIVAENNMDHSSYSEHPGYQAHSLESYIGAPIMVNGLRYGTVNFSSSQKRSEFSDDDKTFVTLAANWIARLIENEQIDRAKDEFVSLASHQLRTPISIINWYTEMLLDPKNGTLNKKQEEYLKEIAIGDEKMTNLVNALLNTSRLDLGTYTIEPEKVDLRDSVTHVLKNYQAQIKHKKITYTEKISKTLSSITADPVLLELIIDNLLSNAVKYTKLGGAITLTAKASGKQRYVLSVTDDGHGIPANQQDKIFNKMFRADNITEQDTDGNGLGLYMVKALVESIGGTITFTSKEKRGTIFIVTLPKIMKSRKGTSRLT